MKPTRILTGSHRPEPARAARQPRRRPALPPRALASLRPLGQARVAAPGPTDTALAFSIHSPHRDEEFCRRLPGPVARAQIDDFSAAQRERYDINSSLLGWSPQIATASHPLSS